MEQDVKAQHTAGPWEWTGGTAVVRNGRYIHVENTRPHKVACANARLIAATPELLEACQLALNAFERNDCIDWGILRAAIAKATGKQP